MSRLYDAMKQMERERQGREQLPGRVPQVLETLSRVAVERGNFEKGSHVASHVCAASRLVALTDTRSLGAERF
jgi:hypothetical protein